MDRTPPDSQARGMLDNVKGISKCWQDPVTLGLYLLVRSERSADGCLIVRGFGQYRNVYQKVAGNAWAHIVAYALWVGPRDPRLDVHHKCRRRDCIEPQHLEQITHRDNCRADSDPERCPYGHERQVDQATGRYLLCKPCNQDACRRYQQRKKRKI